MLAPFSFARVFLLTLVCALSQASAYVAQYESFSSASALSAGTVSSLKIKAGANFVSLFRYPATGNFCAIKFARTSKKPATLHIYDGSLNLVANISSSTGNFDDCAKGFHGTMGDVYFLKYVPSTQDSISFVNNSDTSTFINGEIVSSTPLYNFTVVTSWDGAETQTSCS